jgi:tetratricopeptide (TPR) repeat protein
VWSGYSARQSAELVGLTESAVRSLVRDGVLGDLDRVPARLDFRDLKLLQDVRRWRDTGVPLRRIRRELAAIRQRHNGDAAAVLAGLAITAHRGHLVVREHSCVWRADSGQLVFGFELDAPAGSMASFCDRRRPEPEPEPEDVAGARTASDWFDRALALEDDDPLAAMEAYRKVLELRPDSVETLINLGRLYAESSAIEAAARCFERALELDPGDATAYYNLGVVAQDAGDDRRAVSLYQKALAIDPRLAEAHYNLATIYDRTGDPRAAIRHINEYRKLIRD